MANDLPLKSYSLIGRRCRDLIEQWASWARPESEGGPVHSHAEMNGIELRNLAQNVRELARKAQALIDDPEFHLAPEDQQDDVKLLAQELGAAVDEFEHAASAEQLWKNTPVSERHRLTNSATVDRDVRKQLAARVTLRKSGQPGRLKAVK